MKNYRLWGKPPYNIVTVHGGPGAPGSIAPVARELSKDMGVLEPLQTKKSVEGQIEELAAVIKEYGATPVTLIGHSWGAWLVYLTAARHPLIVKKAILVGSGAFEQKYADNIFPERLSRLNEKDRITMLGAIDVIKDPTTGEKARNDALERFGALCAKADTYSALPPETEPEPLPASEETNRKVWVEAENLRKSGELLKTGKKIKCPVTAISGDYETHLPEGVKEPLTSVLKHFKFILLKKCGHEPWFEKYARDEFFRILREEIVS